MQIYENLCYVIKNKLVQLYKPDDKLVYSALPGSTPRCGEMQPPSGALDLTQKACPGGERPGYARPNLEIVRVPVVPRPAPLNLETVHRGIMSGHSSGPKEPLLNSVKPPASPTCKVPPYVPSSAPPNPVGYPNVLDSRAMSTNNLEITLVSPKKTSGGSVAQPHLNTPNRNNSVVRIETVLLE